MKNPTPDPIKLGIAKQACLDYLYDFDLPTHHWEGVGCTVDPRIDVTYENHFLHSIRLSTTFHTEEHGVGYLEKRPGIECLVKAQNEVDLWTRFLRCMQLAFEHPEGYKTYCLKKQELWKATYPTEYSKMRKIIDNANEWLHQREDEIEEEALKLGEATPHAKIH